MALKLLTVDPVGGGRQPASRVPFADGGGGDVLLGFTRKLEDLLDQEAAIQRVSTLADATSTLNTALDRKKIELATDPDIAGREGKFQQFAQAEFGRLHGGMDRETGALFKRSVNPTVDAASSSVRHAAQKDLLDKALGGLNESTEKLVTASGDARNPNERQALLDQIDANLKQARDGQLLSEAQYQAAKKATLGKADQAYALRLIRDNPGGTAALLGKSSDFLPNLDPVARQGLIDRAGAEVLRRTNLAYTQEARREVAERRATVLSSNTIMKEIVDASATPDGVPDDLLARAKAVVPWHDYQAAKKLKVGGGDIDSKAALATIVPDLDTRDVSKDLSDALLKNEITGSTYKTLVERNRAALKDDQPQSPQRQGRDYIKTVLDPAAAGLGGGMLAGITSGLRAQALLEYDAWVDANRDKIKADPIMATNYALDVGKRYKLAEFAGTTQTLGLPRFTPEGVTKPQFDEKAFEAARAETDRALKAGEISRAEALVQARLLEQWRDALQALKAGSARETTKPAAKP